MGTQCAFRVWAYAFVLTVLSSVPGCKLLDKLLRFNPEMRQLGTTPYKPRGASPISDKVVLIADNQLHNLYTNGVKGFRVGNYGRYIPTAIRPLQLDLFGEHLVEYVINQSDEEFIIHLGDSCDMATTGEFTEFVRTMQAADNGWIMAPGNHDFYFWGFGHTHMRAWKEASTNSGQPMTKNLFIRYYLAALIQQRNQHAADSLATHINGLIEEPVTPVERRSLELGEIVDRLKTISAEGHWQLPVNEHHDSEASLVAIRWKIDDKRPWRSYIIQQAELTVKDSGHQVRAVILDTNQYRNSPGIVPVPFFQKNCGLTGFMLKDQMEAVEEWLGAEGTDGMIWIVVGHHPFQAFPQMHKNVRNRILEWDRDYMVAMYVSAHTHRGGQFYIHNPKRQDDPETTNDTYLPELNLGSILDWPQQYRSLQLFHFHRRKEFLIRAPAHYLYELFDEEDEVDQEWDEKWLPKYGDKDYYMSFAEITDKDTIKTELKLKDILLYTYVRMLTRIPSKHVAVSASRIKDFSTQYSGNDFTGNGVYLERVEGWLSDKHVMHEMAQAIKSKDLPTKTTLLMRLLKWDRRRPVEDSAIQERYRLFQAVMASRYDKLRSKKPGTEDWYISIPKPSAAN